MLSSDSRCIRPPEGRCVSPATTCFSRRERRAAPGRSCCSSETSMPLRRGERRTVKVFQLKNVQVLTPQKSLCTVCLTNNHTKISSDSVSTHCVTIPWILWPSVENLWAYSGLFSNTAHRERSDIFIDAVSAASLSSCTHAQCGWLAILTQKLSFFDQWKRK